MDKQAINKCNTVRLEFNGKTLSLPEWSKELNISRDALKNRMLRGWSVEKTLSTPLLRQGNGKKVLPHIQKDHIPPLYQESQEEDLRIEA